jgi:hypothetical protein
MQQDAEIRYTVEQLVPYDAVNRNKVSIRQLPLFYFPSHSLHVLAPTGHLQVRYTVEGTNILCIGINMAK